MVQLLQNLAFKSKSTKATLDLAASLDVDLETAMIAGSTLRSFGLEAKETQRVVDVMALSTSKSALDYESLRESLKMVAPSARALNRYRENYSTTCYFG